MRNTHVQTELSSGFSSMHLYLDSMEPIPTILSSSARLSLLPPALPSPALALSAYILLFSH